ncbi:MAG: alpha/beta fold hydrolase [Oscillospiraceae bacterium]|nr:alpha/beta fold hydrolase [Oscillospiraceae bacterium]
MSYRICRMEYKSSDNVNTIVSKIYIPNGKIKGVIQIVHGMCEYIDRYDEFMSFLACNGYVTCGNNHLGHGESCRCEKDLGYFGSEHGYLNLVRDARKLNLIMRKDYPNLPYYIFGHSMGSFVVRLLLSRHSEDFTGAVICGTGGPHPFVKTAVQLSHAACRQRGYYYRPRNIYTLAFGNFNFRIKNPKTKHDWLSRDTEIVTRFVNDPYCNFTFTSAGFRDLFSLHGLANQRSSIEAIRKNLPVLLVSGGMDPVGNYGKGVKRVQKMMLDAGIQDVQLHLYSGARHEILNETNRVVVFADILHWIENGKI